MKKKNDIVVIGAGINGQVMSLAAAHAGFSVALIDQNNFIESTLREFDGRAVMLDTQMTGPLPTASSLGINGVVSDLSVVGTLTGGAVETRHILLVEPMTSMIASTLAMLG